MTPLYLLVCISPPECLGAQAETLMPTHMCPAVSQLNYAVIKPRLQTQTGFRVSLTRQLSLSTSNPLRQHWDHYKTWKEEQVETVVARTFCN